MAAQQKDKGQDTEKNTAKEIADAWIAHINGDRSPGTPLEIKRAKLRKVPLGIVLRNLFRGAVLDFIVRGIKDLASPVARKGLRKLKKRFGNDDWLNTYMLEKAQAEDPSRSKHFKVLSIMFASPQAAARAFSDPEIAAALRATLGNEVAAAALLKKTKKTWQ